MTPQDVIAIYNRLKADPHLLPAEVLQGTRTEVHGQLQKESPPPYALPDPEPGKSDDDFHAASAEAMTIREGNARIDALAKLHVEHHKHLEQRRASARAAVSDADRVLFERDRLAGGCAGMVGTVDAHHHAQMRHFRSLWEQTDKLVAEALKGVAQ